MRGIGVVRGVVLGCGVLLMIGGLVTLSMPVAGVPTGLWLVFSGGVLIVAAVLERTRYRSEAAERGHEPPGPGGGEPDPVEPRFRPTDEVFIDPTSGRRMRVLSDPRTGERRYVAEA
jgi:hypothetical protein